MNTFRPGQTVWLEMAGERCEIKELIGSGGQGQVYHTSINGQDCALKWYFPHERDGHAAQRDRAADPEGPAERSLPLAARHRAVPGQPELRLSDAACANRAFAAWRS